jgi:hypothetical protein
LRLGLLLFLSCVEKARNIVDPIVKAKIRSA